MQSGSLLVAWIEQCSRVCRVDDRQEIAMRCAVDFVQVTLRQEGKRATIYVANMSDATLREPPFPLTTAVAERAPARCRRLTRICPEEEPQPGHALLAAGNPEENARRQHQGAQFICRHHVHASMDKAAHV